MEAAKRKRLEGAGFKVGSASDFLGLSEAESLYVDLKAQLAMVFHDMRAARHLTQAEVAKMLGSSQSRIAKMEAADSSVSVDLLVRSVFAVGGSPQDLVKAIQRLRLKPAKSVRPTKRRASNKASARGLASPNRGASRRTADA